MKKLAALVAVLSGILWCQPSVAMYNGSPDWKEPKAMVCSGLSDYPQGLKVSPHFDQVAGASLDAYIFISMEGAMGLYYFQMEFPPAKNVIKGTATYIDSTNWGHKDYHVSCTVSEWYK
jgi:hypothetical protein